MANGIVKVYWEGSASAGYHTTVSGEYDFFNSYHALQVHCFNIYGQDGYELIEITHFNYQRLLEQGEL